MFATVPPAVHIEAAGAPGCRDAAGSDEPTRGEGGRCPPCGVVFVVLFFLEDGMTE